MTGSTRLVEYCSFNPRTHLRAIRSRRCSACSSVIFEGSEQPTSQNFAVRLLKASRPSLPNIFTHFGGTLNTLCSAGSHAAVLAVSSAPLSRFKFKSNRAPGITEHNNANSSNELVAYKGIGNASACSITYSIHSLPYLIGSIAYADIRTSTTSFDHASISSKLEPLWRETRDLKSPNASSILMPILKTSRRHNQLDTLTCVLKHLKRQLGSSPKRSQDANRKQKAVSSQQLEVDISSTFGLEASFGHSTSSSDDMRLGVGVFEKKANQEAKMESAHQRPRA